MTSECKRPIKVRSLLNSVLKFSGCVRVSDCGKKGETEVTVFTVFYSIL